MCILGGNGQCKRHKMPCKHRPIPFMYNPMTCNPLGKPAHPTCTLPMTHDLCMPQNRPGRAERSSSVNSSSSSMRSSVLLLGSRVHAALGGTPLAFIFIGTFDPTWNVGVVACHCKQTHSKAHPSPKPASMAVIEESTVAATPLLIDSVCYWYSSYCLTFFACT